MIFPALAPQTGFIAVEADTLAHARAVMTLRGINWQTADIWTADDLARNELFDAFTQNLPRGTRVWNGDAAPVTICGDQFEGHTCTDHHAGLYFVHSDGALIWTADGSRSETL